MRKGTQTISTTTLALILAIGLSGLAIAQSPPWPPVSIIPQNAPPPGYPVRPVTWAPTNTEANTPAVNQAAGNFPVNSPGAVNNTGYSMPNAAQPPNAAPANLSMQPNVVPMTGGVFSPEPIERRPIYVGLPVPRNTATGEVTVVPNVQRTPPNGMQTPQLPGTVPNNNSAVVANSNASPSMPAVRQISADMEPPSRNPETERGVRAQTTAWEAPPKAQLPPPPGAGIESLPTPPSPYPAPSRSPTPAGAVPTPPGSVPMSSVVPETLGGQPLYEPNDEHCPETEAYSPIWSDVCNIAGHLFHHPPVCTDGESGIGHERVMLAPLFIENTQPMSDLRFRFDFGYNVNRPDRDEYFWSKSSALGGRGPAIVERNIDYQEIRAIWEVGSKSFSATTEYPIRLLNPELNDDNNGFGDMEVATKILLMDGVHWQISQVFRTYMPTGSAMKGDGTGHVSLEPGFLFRYKWSPETYIHSELKYWIPIAGSDYAGQIIKFSVGVSHLWYESDTFAIIPTLEFRGFYPQDGYETDQDTLFRVSADDSTVVTASPGARIEWDTGGDLGLIEMGIGSEFALTHAHWPNTLIRFELRYNF